MGADSRRCAPTPPRGRKGVLAAFGLTPEAFKVLQKQARPLTDADHAALAAAEAKRAARAAKRAANR